MDDTTCACGCGAPTTRRWARGHNQRVRNSMQDRSRPFIELWLGHITPGDEQNCWDWSPAGNPRFYPYIKYHGQIIGAHVATYRHFTGEIPAGMEIRHTCDNRRCCNPAHLIVGTRLDNVRDMLERKRNRNGWEKRARDAKGRFAGKDFNV